MLIVKRLECKIILKSLRTRKPKTKLAKKSLKIPKVYRRRTDNTMVKRKRTKGQINVYKTELRRSGRIISSCSTSDKRGIFGSVASLLAGTLNQGKDDRNQHSGVAHQLRDKYSICRCCWNVATYKWKAHNWNHLFCCTVSFLTVSRCTFRGVCIGMKQTYLYLWYPVFQAHLCLEERNLCFY